MAYKSTFEGAYLFSNAGDATSVLPPTVTLQVYRGKLFDRVVQMVSPTLQQEFTVYHCANSTDVTAAHPDCTSVKVTTRVGPLKGTEDIIARYHTGLSSPMLYTDDTGFQYLERPYVSGIFEQTSANYYPSIYASYVAEDSSRANAHAFAVVLERASGISSQSPGDLEVMLHRRSTMDDKKGLGEALDDNSTITVSHRLVLAPVSSASHGALQLMLSRSAAYFNNPARALFASPQHSITSASSCAPSLPVAAHAIGTPLPPSVHVLTVEQRLQIQPHTVVVRFINLATEQGEDATVDLTALFPMCASINANETSLSLIESPPPQRRVWDLNGYQIFRNGSQSSTGTHSTVFDVKPPAAPFAYAQINNKAVNIAPLGIRTLIVECLH